MSVILNNWSCPQNVNVRINLYIRPKLLIQPLFLLLLFPLTHTTHPLTYVCHGSFCKCVLILDFTSQLYHPHSRPRPRLAYTIAPGLKFVIHFLRWHFILHTRHHHPAAAVPRPKYYVRHLFLFNALTATLCHRHIQIWYPITLQGSRIHMALHCTATATTSQTLDQYVYVHMHSRVYINYNATQCPVSLSWKWWVGFEFNGWFNVVTFPNAFLIYHNTQQSLKKWTQICGWVHLITYLEIFVHLQSDPF